MLQTVRRGDKVGVAGVSGRLSSQALSSNDALGDRHLYNGL